MRTIAALVALAFALTLAPQCAVAQTDTYLELLRSDIKAETVAILTEVMEFSDADGEQFWPIYREYDLEAAKLGDRRIALLKGYAESFDTLSNEKAKELADAHFKLQSDRLKLSKNYYKKVSKALGENTGARFTQVMNQVQLLIDVQLAASMPLISKYTETVQEASR
jgi:hypothetical protein